MRRNLETIPSNHFVDDAATVGFSVWDVRGQISLWGCFSTCRSDRSGFLALRQDGSLYQTATQDKNKHQPPAFPLALAAVTGPLKVLANSRSPSGGKLCARAATPTNPMEVHLAKSTRSFDSLGGKLLASVKPRRAVSRSTCCVPARENSEYVSPLSSLPKNQRVRAAGGCAQECLDLGMLCWERMR
eukprot:5115603-Amphidinium_carterae.1